jgi:hypothetical protein
MRSMFAGLRRIAWLAAGIAVLAVSLITTPTTSSAAERTTTAAPAPPTAREFAAVKASASGFRRVVVKTTDRRPGGKLEADIIWWGKGPFNGRIYGSVQDLEADGYCVAAWAWADGFAPIINVDRKIACPAGNAASVNFTFRKTWRVLVKVCLVKAYHTALYSSYCSRWT